MNLFFRLATARRHAVVAACLALAACAAPCSGPSLYERLGGLPAIQAVVDQTIDGAAADPRTRRSFEGIKLKAVKESVAAQLCEAAGGPCKYRGDDMKMVHQGLDITSAEFDAFAQQLVATLNQLKVGAREQDELLKILAPMKPDIVTR